MAASSIAGQLDDVKSGFTSAALVGTETINATVTAGQVAIIVDDGVPEHMVFTLIERLREAYFESVSKVS